jgi:ribosomal protein L37E
MSDDIRKGKGYGYRAKTGKICMEKCFSCGKENYALAVSSGTCAWCGYDANKKVARKAVRGPSPLAGPIKLLILEDRLKMANRDFQKKHRRLL